MHEVTSLKDLRRTTVLAVMALLLAAPAAPAQRREAEREKTIMRAVSLFLEQAHFSGRELDDTISMRAFKAFLNGLDPLKLYFDRSDIDEFREDRRDLDDMLRAGRSDFARRVFERFKKRLGQRTDLVLELLQGEFDFTDEEYFVTDPDLRDYPESDEEARELWRERLEYSLLSLRNDGVGGAEARDRLRKRYERLRDRIKKETREEIVSRFINTIATSYDPHTLYMAPKPFEDFRLGVTLNYQGIGALLGEEEDGSIVIRRVIPGGAVERYGKIKAGDRILAVGQGDDGDVADIVGLRVDDVVKLIRGEKDTVVRLVIQPAAGGPKRVHPIRRAEIRLEERAAKSKIHEEETDKGKLKIGVIDLPGFYRDSRPGADLSGSSTEDVRRILREFKSKNVDAVVLDLRRNGGGFLPEALGVAGLFLDEGPIVQVRGNGERPEVLEDPIPGTEWDGPLTVLVGKASASASEIVAGAIRDYRRGLLIGANTHGKGTVQTTFDLARQLRRGGKPGEMGVLKLTVQQFYQPSGDSMQLRGVPVDVAVPSLLDTLDNGESELPYALPFDRIKPVPHPQVLQLSESTVETLARGSLARRTGSPAMTKLERQLAAYQRLRDRKRIPLQEKAFQAAHAELKALQNTGNETSTDDVALLEALAITADFARALHG